MFKKFFILMFAIVLPVMARAELKVDIVAGTMEPVSVAVQKFEVASGASKTDAATIRTIVEDNLKRTGLFHIVNHNAFPEYVKLDVEEYQKLKEKITIYELTINVLKELGNKEVDKILEVMNEELN